MSPTMTHRRATSVGSSAATRRASCSSVRRVRWSPTWARVSPAAPLRKPMTMSAWLSPGSSPQVSSASSKGVPCAMAACKAVTWALARPLDRSGNVKARASSGCRPQESNVPMRCDCSHPTNVFSFPLHDYSSCFIINANTLVWICC